MSAFETFTMSDLLIDLVVYNLLFDNIYLQEVGVGNWVQSAPAIIGVKSGVKLPPKSDSPADIYHIQMGKAN